MLRGQGKLAEAETTILEALAMCRKMLGDKHGDVAASLMELGTFLREQGRSAEEEPIRREALEDYSQVIARQSEAVGRCTDRIG